MHLRQTLCLPWKRAYRLGHSICLIVTTLLLQPAQGLALDHLANNSEDRQLKLAQLSCFKRLATSYNSGSCEALSKARVSGGYIAAVTFTIVEGIGLAAIIMVILYKKYCWGKRASL